MKTWKWLHATSLIALNSKQVVLHGGASGVRDEGLLSSALARPLHLASYGSPEIFDLAAAYAFGLIHDHPFLDGNKRTGFLAAFTFLDINGFELQANETDAYMAVLALARKEIDEKTFSAWLKHNSKRIKK